MLTIANQEGKGNKNSPAEIIETYKEISGIPFSLTFANNLGKYPLVVEA